MPRHQPQTPARLCDWTDKGDDLDVPCHRRAVATVLVLSHDDALELGLCARHAEEVRSLPTVIEQAADKLVMRWA